MAIAAASIGGVLSTAPASADSLKFWSWRGEDRAAYEELIADFEATHPDTSIEFVTFEPSQYQTILATALAGGEGPDIIHVRAYGNLETIAGPGFLAPLDGKVDLSGFSDLAIQAETLRSDGKVYAVPFASQTLVIYYNTDIFAENGLSVPQTWDEFVSTMTALEDAGVTPLANGTQTAWQNEILVGAVVPGFYGQGFDSDILQGKATFADPRFVGALDKLLEIRDFMPRGFTGIDYSSAQQLFMSGRAAMFAGGSWEIANFRRQVPDLNFDIMPAPAVAPGQPRLVATFFDGGYAANAASDHQDEALEFLRFTATTAFSDKLVARLSNISPVPGTRFDDPLLQEVAAFNKSSVPYIMLVNFRFQEPSGSVLLQQWVQRMMAGDATPAEVGDEVTAGIATYFAPFQN